MDHIRGILKQAGISFGYRSRDAACLYMWHWQHDQLEKLLPKSAALDYCIIQKVLPKIYGQGERLGSALEELLAWLQGGSASGTASDATRSYLRSAEKVERMIKRLTDEGTTTYWGS